MIICLHAHVIPGIGIPGSQYAGKKSLECARIEADAVPSEVISAEYPDKTFRFRFAADRNQEFFFDIEDGDPDASGRRVGFRNERRRDLAGNACIPGAMRVTWWRSKR